MDSEDELLCGLALVVVKQSVGKKEAKKEAKENVNCVFMKYIEREPSMVFQNLLEQ